MINYFLPPSFLKWVYENAVKFKESCKKRGINLNFDEYKKLYECRNELMSEQQKFVSKKKKAGKK